MTATKQYLILLVEDNPADADLVEEALADANLDCRLQVLGNGKRALDYISLIENDQAPCPDLVLLDLNLPQVSGEAVLKRIRSSPRCGSVKVLIVTSSDAAHDRRNAMELGATDYFRKPSSLAQYLELGPKVRDLLQ